MPLYNMDSIEASLRQFDEVNKKISDVDDVIKSSYVMSKPKLQSLVMLYIDFARLDSVGKKIHDRWNRIIEHVKEEDNDYSNMVKNHSLLNTDSISELLMIRDGLLDIFPNSSAMYNDIKLGSEVGDYNVSKGHDTAAWSVDGKNAEDLNAKYVTKESKFMRFAVVNEDGSIGYISNEEGITLEQFCVDNNVTPDRVAVDVGSKDGKSQAWVSVKELTDGVASASVTSSGIQGASNASTSNSTTNNVNATGASSQSTPSASMANASQANTVNTSDTSTTTNINSIVDSVEDASSSIQNEATTVNTSQLDSTLDKLSDVDAMKVTSEDAQKTTEKVFTSNKQSLDDMDPEARKMLTPDVEKALQNLNN